MVDRASSSVCSGSVSLRSKPAMASLLDSRKRSGVQDAMVRVMALLVLVWWDWREDTTWFFLLAGMVEGFVKVWEIWGG